MAAVSNCGCMGRKLGRNFAAFAFAIRVDAARIDWIFRLRPGNQLADRFVILGPHLAVRVLCVRSEEDKPVAKSLASERLTDRKEVVAGRPAVLLKTQEQPDLFGGIGSARGRDPGGRFYNVLHDRIARVVLQVGLIGRPGGVVQGPGRRTCRLLRQKRGGPK